MSDKKLSNKPENKTISGNKQSLIDNVKQGLSLQFQAINQNIEKTLSPDIFSQIQEHVNSKEPFDAGSEGVVYKVPVKINQTVRYFLVAKKRFDHNTQKEYTNHKILTEIITGNYEFKDIVAIPTLYGHFEDATTNESYIIMDYIQGKTLFTKIVEKLCGETCENDKEATKILKNFIADETGIVYPQFNDIYNQLKKYITSNKIKLFSYQEGLKIKYRLKQFITHIHKNGFYHRDIGDNLRNIIIGDDKKTYIIDFGQSILTHKKGNTNIEDDKEIYYHHEIGGKEYYFPQDEALLSIIDLLTITPPKKEPREL